MGTGRPSSAGVAAATGLAVAGLGLVVAAAACGHDGASAPPDADIPFDRETLLAHLADDVLIPTYDTFADQTAAVSTAIDGYCAALDGGDAPAIDGAQAGARAAWVTAMDTWEGAEAVLVGPAARIDQMLRNRIYSWPFVAPCSIDKDVVLRWTTPARYDVTARLDNERSLAAIEYLLYDEDATSSCLTTPAGWDALGADRAKARCALASAIAVDVDAQAHLLANTWHRDGGNYRDTFVFAGSGASTIPTQREAINMVSDALFYVDRMVKDMKLGEPAGIIQNACGSVETPCLLEVELRYSDRAVQAIRSNLKVLRVGFTGSGAAVDGPGFDDYLTAAGVGSVADRMVAEIDDAIGKADALPDDFIGDLSNDRDALVALHEQLKVVVNDFKTQFLTVLGLDIPAEIAGDND
ncbi:MAG TPA: imelysin family protein [Kofleriaceae bacterium]|nr:imelysin family protein [Kofleriaceae bacterium]